MEDGSRKLRSLIWRLENYDLMYTLASKHPFHNRLYISIDENPFTTCICLWYGIALYGYFLHSTSLDVTLKPFKYEDTIYVLNEVDQEEEVEEDEEDGSDKIEESSCNEDEYEHNKSLWWIVTRTSP